MTDAPRRRGRPPGSKNRPKQGWPGRAHVLDEPDSDPPPPIPMPKTDISGRAGGWDVRDGYVEAHTPLLESPTIKVVLSVKRRDAAFGDPGATEELEVEWPAGWRLPQTGETVHIRKDWGGLVNFVDFDLAGPVVRIFLR